MRYFHGLSAVIAFVVRLTTDTVIAFVLKSTTDTVAEFERLASESIRSMGAGCQHHAGIRPRPIRAQCRSSSRRR